MGIFPSCKRVSTTVWLHYFDFNEMLEEKARWELHKSAALNKSWKQHLTKQQLNGLRWPYKKKKKRC